jgi:ankyrin repeat protein
MGFWANWVTARKAKTLAKELMHASAKGHLSIVLTLIDGGADVNAKMSDGRTALMLASEFRLPLVEGLLVKAGAI